MDHAIDFFGGVYVQLTGQSQLTRAVVRTDTAASHTRFDSLATDETRGHDELRFVNDVLGDASVANSFVAALGRIGPETAVVVSTIDGGSVTGRLLSVGRDSVTVDETVGTGPVRLRRVLSRVEIRIGAITRVSVPDDESRP